MSDEAQPGPSLSWRVIASTTTILAIGAVGALVIVSSVKDADTLSVVALALAILAFVIQIIVFVAQTWSDSQQARHTQSVNAETRALLGELQAMVRGTNEVINAQYNKLLDKVLLAKDEVSSENPEEEVDSESLRLALDNILSGMPSDLTTERTTVRPTRSISNDERIPSARLLSKWPTPAGVKGLANEGINSLGEAELSRLKFFADDLELSAELEVPGGRLLSVGATGVPVLLGERYIASGVERHGSKRSFHLTPKGEIAARLFTAEGDPPQYVVEAIPEIAEWRAKY